MTSFTDKRKAEEKKKRMKERKAKFAEAWAKSVIK